MKINDLFEYNMGIQGKDANAKSKVDEPEIDVPGEEILDPKQAEKDQEEAKKQSKKLQTSIKRAGAMTGQNIAAPQYTKGSDQAQQGKRPTGASLDSMMSMNQQFNKALTNDTTKNIVLKA